MTLLKQFEISRLASARALLLRNKTQQHLDDTNRQITGARLLLTVAHARLVKLTMASAELDQHLGKGPSLISTAISPKSTIGNRLYRNAKKKRIA